jgi:hypothetical protein
MVEDNRPRSGDAAVLTRTWSDTEAELIVGLLRSHGIYAWTASDVPHNLYPLTVDGLGEVRIMVSSDDVEEGAALLAEYADEVSAEGGPEGRG